MGLEIGLRSHLDIPRVKQGVGEAAGSPCDLCSGDGEGIADPCQKHWISVL